MPDPTNDKVSDATRASEHEDEHVDGGADRAPTPEEEAAAERAPEPDGDVAANYERQNEVGANVKGEGQIG